MRRGLALNTCEPKKLNRSGDLGAIWPSKWLDRECAHAQLYGVVPAAA
jgi:hypothetical protein